MVKILLFIGFGVLAFMATRFLVSQVKPGPLGVREGRLAACPQSPNCVSSQATDESQFVAPFQYTGERPTDRLQEVLEQLPRVTIISKTDGYLHAEFKSEYMGFIDDVEFYFVPEESLIHVRSASRLGRSDFGVNKERIEKIRSLWESYNA